MPTRDTSVLPLEDDASYWSLFPVELLLESFPTTPPALLHPLRARGHGGDVFGDDPTPSDGRGDRV